MDSYGSKHQWQKRSKRFGLLRAAVLQAANRRKTLETFLHELAARFPRDAEVALEVAEFYCDAEKSSEASAWLRKTELALRHGALRNRREVEEQMLTFRAEILARRGHLRAAQRLVVRSLQRMPYSGRLAFALDLLHRKKRAR